MLNSDKFNNGAFHFGIQRLIDSQKQVFGIINHHWSSQGAYWKLVAVAHYFVSSAGGQGMITTARVTAAQTAVHARRLPGFAARATTGTASVARMTVIEFECD